jgi:hypothetical protein
MCILNYCLNFNHRLETLAFNECNDWNQQEEEEDNFTDYVKNIKKKK